MTDAFFVPDGDAFVATSWTRGPWDPGAQHAGPPSALLGRAIEALEPGNEMRVARVTVEILRPIPVAALRVEANVVRPGKRVQYAEAALVAGDETVARASAWRIRPSEAPVPEAGLDTTTLPAPDGLEAFRPFADRPEPSYFNAMEWRFARGSFFEPGPAAAWMRMRYPLVAGEEPSALVRTLTVADSGNGISQVVPIKEYVFINTELSVHLVRPAGGEWICLDAVTRLSPEGVGFAESTLWDAEGRFGAGRQSLLVAAR